ncbi:LOW QUALITY PROTEIN: Titin [Gryllus bimaculatus]|nr:LOW QUALITY PROTEIN: Titin [Gryllus bimaculatus]
MQRQQQQQQLHQQQQQQTFVQQQQVSQQTSQQSVRRVEQHVTHQVTSQQHQQVQEMVIQGSLQPAYGGRPANISPPVFEQIFRNARFAQGGNALFEGKVRGQPKPVVSWTRKGAPLLESGKYRMSYDEQSGKVSLLINTIGPGDEGEYTCTAQNQYGEAICSVYIQPEGQLQPQISGYQKEYAQTVQSMEQTQSTLQRYQKQMSAYGNGTVVEEDFKVDTFEYRLLREVEFRESITRRFIGEIDSTINTVVEHSLGPAVPPQIVQKPRNSKLSEGSVATFEARLTANPRPRLTWFKNGQRITSTQKYQTSFSNQQATLKVQNLSCTDSGHYTLLAENPQGCVVSSAYLAVEPSSVQDGLYGNIREQTKSTVVETTTVETDGGKSLAPNFVRVCTDREVTEGKMTRFDCRVTGRPYPDVAWFINGRQVSDDATHKILVNESGNHALMITNVHRSDAGVVSCIARNKSGETSFQCNLLVIEKEQVVAPKFVERFTTVHVKEGEPVVLNARAVGTPVPRITWQKDGVPITPGQNINIRTDSGASTLDIPRAKASDAAWYQCTAQNVAGSTATRARLFVEIPKSSAPQPRRLNLPRPTKVIEPEPQPGPEVIYLRHVERAKPHAPEPQQDQIYPPPQFIIPLSNVQQVEGGRVHFEARIEPVGDPTMRVEWFINGRPLEASSRATTIFRFGFIALDLISIILEDSGEYLCRVTSSSGSVESRALLSVTARASIEQSSQHPDSLQYIQQLEDYSHYQRQESLEETIYQRPNFIRPLQNLGELQEGRNAHFEAQLTPVSDPSMKVEWYKDGKTITASSRITTLFNFGYVSLNIMHLRVEDAGTYTVRAVNALGEAISSSTLKILARTSVTGDLGIPEQQRYIEKVEELEAYQQQQQYKYTKEVPESTSPPEFKSPIQDQLNIHEGGFAHFEARLEPIGDSTLRTEWLKDGRPVEASSRITTFFNFGYVALTIKYVTTHDIGTYVCCAYNSLGQATTTARLTVLSKQDIILDSQHPGGLEKIQYLEDSRYSRSLHEETTATQKPRFLGPLKGTNKIVEGQRAHFEVRVEPQNDINMIIEWYFNGKVIMSANRIQTHHDFGYIALDIENVRSEDAGTYTVVARNALGEAQMSATMEVETRSSIDTSSLHHGTYEKTQRLESSKFVEPQYHIEEISKSKPIFVQPLQDPKPVSEGKNIHLECRLEPMGDPTMRVEWFYNGRSITVGSRFRTYYDFGYIALDIVHATSLDSGEYTVRASNHLGSAHTSACVRVISRSDILTESQNEAALEQIQILEDSARHRRTMQEDITIMQAPQFTRPLHNIETVEGTNIHLECRLQPVGDPTMRVDWFVNGRPVKTGHRFRPAYDFDYVALDLLSVYAVDSGVYTCQARNQLGEAVTSCSVKIIAKKDLILESQHPSGLEKIQYLEDASKYKRIEHIDEVVNVKPRFVTKPKSLDNMREGQHAHFECKLEPVTDSNLKVEWYKNGRPIIVGHRFRPIHDFGYVALDIIDLIAEDSGVYSCRAVNLVGADETTCSLTCRSTAQIVTGTHNEMGLEQIQHLEDRSKYHRAEFSEEITKQAPIFTTSLKHIEIKEGQRAHFECRLIPVSDPTMKVEWFHNNAPVKSGSRFTETNNFGFVALDITYCYPEDSAKKSIYLESQHQEALVQLNYLEDSSRYQRQTAQEETVSQAPVFTQPMKDVKCAENQAAHFEARLIPVANRVTTMHDFGYVALNMKYVYPEDSGTYTCRAINELGQAVTSATLVVHSKASLLLESQHEGALEKLQMLEDSSRYQRREEEEVIVKQPPKFTAQLNGPTNLVEGQSAHYECRIEPYPDPNLKVEWFHNGKPLQTGHRFRTTYDFGFAALDILTVYGEDSGEYTCRATNKLGHATSSIKKIQYLEDDSRHKRTAAEDAVILEKPQFGRPLRNIENLAEGLSAHLEATLTPVNDPTMKVEWFCNGKPIPQGHRFKTTYDFGFVALDILYAYAEDSGTYMCKARNAVGEAVTTCSVKVQAKSGLYLDTLDEQRLKKIKDLETLERPKKVEAEPEAQRPVFITPLNNLEHLKEGEHAHLECRVEPINDANLKIEWFVNGVAIKTGHRFRTTHDFGYVALDVLYTYPEDSGTYMCKATNFVGEAVNTCTISVAARRSIYLESQHPEGLQKIQELEAQGRPGRLEVEEPIPTPPRFITELRGTTELVEGQTAHFEAQVEPLHDPNLRIELYHNGKPLPSASRFHITFDFGYLALDISHIVPEDAGEYSAKAINALGQCTSTISVRVQGKSNIILESQRPEGLEKIRQLEEHTPFRQPDIPEPTRQRPVFTQPLQNIDGIAEGQTAHFECRLIPVGDPTLKVEWFRNEKPLETSSRITKTHDFGYVALDMTHVRGEDEGVYMCRASNTLGEAVTTASMKIKTKANIQLETQHPEGMKKIQQLEQGRVPKRSDEPDKAFEKPIFTQVLTGPSELWESQNAHFECRVVPVGDPSLRFEWYVNGVELKMGSRFHVTHDFGFVTLDISKVVTEDSGVYMCKAINNAAKSSIVGEPMQPDAWQKIQLKEAEMNKVPEMFVDTSPQQAPVFTTHLVSHEKLVEGQHILLEAQVEPRADPNLRIEWFKNGVALTTGTRIRSTFDFGLVTLNINGLRADDSAIYTCRAYNLLGEAVSTCTIKVEDRHWLLGSSLRPEALPQIEALEQPKVFQTDAPEPVYESPVFITHLNNIECQEGESVHFECRVEPSKDPTLNIEWFVNGKPLPMGARFKSTYDFGYVALDINHAYAEDSGVYMCKATNSKGQASTSGTLKCTSKQNIYLDTQHPQGKAGLEKVEEVDEAYAARLQREGSRPEQEFPKPIFIVPLHPEFSLGENEALHLECQVEPKEDPNLKVEWYFNGKNLEHGSRFKMTCDFGFVTLDLTDVYERDQGIYTCKAHNKQGEAFTSTTVYCKSKSNLIEHTQHPKGAEGLEKIQDLEESLRRQEGVLPDGEEGHPPVFTSQFQNLKNLSEGEIAHFEASLTPVGDQTMTVEWFYNGEALKASHRTRTVHAFGMVVLEILGTKIEDSGNYTCRATNKWGRAEISVELECVEKSKGQKPRFTTQIQSLEGLKDGDSAHFECTLTPVGDPHLKVEWFHNGQPLRHSSRIKTVSDFGFVVLDIAYVQSHDSGEYVCRASNKYGEDFTKATIKCQGKGGVYFDTLQPDSLARIRELETSQGSQMATPTSPVLEPPVFTTHISDVTQLVEGQSAHFEARLTPVNDPNLTVEWFYNGKKLPHGHRYRTFHDFGIVILDILYCYEENSGVYECRAVNKVGQDVTKATLKCVSKANLILDSQLPQGMEGGLEKIQTLEDSLIRNQDEKVSEVKGQAPMFTVPLSNIDSLREGENAHFEARLIPTDDPKLKVEWFWNGKPLKTGSRFRTFCDFGFVILEISPVYPEDSGEYSCRAFNDFGQAVTTATMRVQGKRSIILESQLPKGMEHTIEKIAELEGLGLAPDQPSADEDVGRPPEFITTPVDLTLTENSLAHFECRLTPVNDSSMRVEWFHNGKALSAGSRIKTINDFGFVILEVAGVYQRDSGLYTCKATNRHGEATVSCKLQVRGRQGIILEPQLPSNFRTGTESIQKLEENLYKKDEILAEEEKPNPPKFIVELKDISDVAEGAPIHFECRVEPVGDSSMRIDWFHNGRPFATGSRVHMLNDFGFIVLDMDYTYARDSGEYVCRATNKWGSATTKATLTCKAKHDVVLESQLPQGMSGAKLKELERGPVTKAFPEDAPLSPPKFITQITSVGIGEGEPVHFECRVEPKTDPKLRIEWYRNGKLLPSGHRFRTMYDLGFVSLDILYTYPEDSGEYVCRAVNDLGEDTTRATISCKKLPTIILQNQVPKGMKKSEALMQMEATIKKYTSEIHLTEDDLYDPDKKQPPRFVTQIKDQTTLEEMQSTKFECQLAPVGDPNMKVEWFLNGKPLPHKNRFTPIYDFGYVAMNFGWVYPEDSGEYLCRATNLYGMDETRAVIKTAGKPGIIYESQLPKGMKSIERIREMEAAWQIVPEEPDESEKPKSAPVFVTKPETYTAVEGEPARYCCRVTGFPRPRVMWVVNGHTVVNGTRYKLTYDGMWHLDIPKTRQYDNGKVEVIARNSAGEAIAVADLVVKQRQDDYRNVLKNSPRPWYDYELTQYQRERQETELERVFEERQGQQIELSEHHLKQKIIKEPETEWQQSVKKKKGEDYYSKLKELEDEQVVKETRLRESSHQFAIPGEKVVHKSLAKGMAQSYEEKVERSENTGVQTGGLSQISSHTSDTVIDSQHVKGTVIPEPAESAVHGREVHVAKQKQTQKEKPAKPPFFTKKIQPCRAFEQDQARFEVEFDGDPLPTVKWYRENFPIVSSADLQVHTFSTKSVLILRQVFMEDSGVFSVIAENRGGTAKCSANLVVEERRRQGRGGVIPPSFLTTIQNTVVVAGQLARFDARITGTKPLDVYWLKNGKKILPDIRHKSLEEDNTFTLLILESLPEDSGKYECVAINGAGEARCDAECFVQTPSSKPTSQGKAAPTGSDQAPTLLEPMKGQPVQEGQAVAFKCKISGKPVPQIKWFKGDTPIKPSKYFQMQKDGDIYTLHISEAFPEDEGMYKCVASNTAGSVTTSAELKVLAPSTQEITPSLAPMRDVIVPEGNPAQFRTQVSGKPQPNIQWFREGALIPQSADFQMIQDGNNVVLLISTTYEEDSGVFTCRATNSAGQVETSAKLIVKKEEETGIAPHFIQPLQAPKISLEQPLVLECVVVGTPVPVLKWFAKNQEIIPKKGKEVSYNSELGIATLKILKPTSEDFCFYSIQASNAFGSAECRIDLIFGEETKISKPTVLQAPKITKPLEAKVVYTGEPITLESEFEGIPVPDVKWYHNGKEIKLTKHIKMTTVGYKTNLHITEAQKTNSGKYEIQVVNCAGDARSSGTISVTEPQPEMKEVKPPRFVKPIKPQIIAEGEVVILETLVESHPICSFQWFQHSFPVKSSPELRVVSTGNRSILLIDKATPHHSGTYTCRAENVGGSVTYSATVNVLPEPAYEEVTELESPRFVKKLASIRIMDGQEVAGKPTPHITWLHKNKPLKEAKDVTISQDSEGVCKLSIQEVFPEDAGEYTCYAVNPVGEAVCSASLVVEAYEYVPDSEIASVTIGTSMIIEKSSSEEDENLPMQQTQLSKAPHFTTKLPEIVPIRNGELTRLEVKVEGFPKPQIHWHKQGVEVTPSRDFQIEEFENVLTITEVFPDDSGEIICEAQNELGIDTTKTELVVEEQSYEGDILSSYNEKGSKVYKAVICQEDNIGEKLERNVAGVSRTEFHFQELKEKTAEVVKIIYVSENKEENVNNFHTLSPIEESSEPSTAKNSERGDLEANLKKSDDRVEYLKLLSASCETLHHKDESIRAGLPIKYLTFPRPKIPVLSPVRNNACYNIPEDTTQYSLQPRELDPASFHQLHMADSQEELQEFLLLESQCMTTEGWGLAAAFLASDFEQNSSDEDRDQWVLTRPLSDVTWYKNDKSLRNTKNIQIRIKNNKTTCTILKATPEDEGTYVCKAVSDIGTETTRAQLYVQEKETGTLNRQKKTRRVIKQRSEEEEEIEEIVDEGKRKVKKSFRATRPKTDEEKLKIVEETPQEALVVQDKEKTVSISEVEVNKLPLKPTKKKEKDVKKIQIKEETPVTENIPEEPERKVEETRPDDKVPVIEDTGTNEAIAKPESKPVKKPSKKKKETKPASVPLQEEIKESKEKELPELVPEEEKQKEEPEVSKPEPISPKETSDKKAKTKLPKPQKVDALPQLMKIERKEIKPTKLKVTEVAPKEEVPLFAQIKLRKSSIQKREIKSTELPKVMLKSNLKVIEYPPMEQTPIITLINVKPDKGILSRNVEEALKPKKKKIKQMKDTEKEEVELEKPETFEIEEKEKTEEKKIEETTWVREPKKVQVEDVVPKKLVIGKGNVPEIQELSPENIKLKKIPQKPQDEEVPEEEKGKKKEPDEVPLKDAKKRGPLDGLAPFVGKVDEGSDLELEKYEKVEPVKKEESSTPEKLKKPKLKPVKPEQEVEEFPLKLGKPKKVPEEEEKDITLKKKMGEPVPEIPEEITLKPFKKEKPIEEPKEDIVKVPKPEADKQVPDEEQVTMKIPKGEFPEKKKTKIKKPKTEEKPAVQEEPLKDVKEETEEIVVTSPKKLEPKVIEDEEITQEIILKPKKMQPKVEEEFTLIKETEKPVEDINEDITISVMPKTLPTEDITETVNLKKKKPKKEKLKVVEDVEEAVIIKPSSKKPEETIDDKEPQKFEVESVTEEITIKKIQPQKPDEEEDTNQTFTLKPKPKIPVKEVSDETTVIKLQPEKPEEIEEVKETFSLKKKKKEVVSDDVNEEITIRKKKPVQIPEDVSEHVTLKQKKVKEIPTTEVSEEISITKLIPRKSTDDEEGIVHEEQPEEVIEEIVLKKLSKQKPSVEEISEEVTLKPKPKKKSVPETYEEEDISMSGRVRLRKQKPMTYGEETGEQTITITQEVEQEGPEEIVEIIEEEPEEGVTIELRRKPSYHVEEPLEEVIHLGYPSKHQTDEVEGSFQVQLKSKEAEQSYTVEEVEEEFQFGLKKENLAPRGSLYEEESLAVKLKPKEKPPKTLHQGVEEVIVTEYEEGHNY